MFNSHHECNRILENLELSLFNVPAHLMESLKAEMAKFNC